MAMPFDLDNLAQLFGDFNWGSQAQPMNAAGQPRCAGCGADERDLRTWPPQTTTGTLLYCASCRTRKALAAFK